VRLVQSKEVELTIGDLDRFGTTAQKIAATDLGLRDNRIIPLDYAFSKYRRRVWVPDFPNALLARNPSQLRRQVKRWKEWRPPA
jgi:hypothetical protein